MQPCCLGVWVFRRGLTGLLRNAARSFGPNHIRRRLVGEAAGCRAEGASAGASGIPGRRRQEAALEVNGEGAKHRVGPAIPVHCGEQAMIETANRLADRVHDPLEGAVFGEEGGDDSHGS